MSCWDKLSVCFQCIFKELLIKGAREEHPLSRRHPPCAKVPLAASSPAEMNITSKMKDQPRHFHQPNTHFSTQLKVSLHTNLNKQTKSLHQDVAVAA